MNSLLTIVIPCYNEAESIPEFFPKLLDFAKSNNFLVIAVNDGSSDNSRTELEKFTSYQEFTIVTHKVNQGYGAATKSGLSAVTTPYAITIDADGQHRLIDVLKCFECIKETQADLVVGVRQNNASGFYRSMGKQIIRLFAEFLFNISIQDLNSGMKCYYMKEVFPYLPLCPNTMAFSDVMQLLMINDRKLVKEVPIVVETRATGSSTISTKTALITLSEILNLSVLLRPLVTFSRLGIIFNILGLGWCIYTYCNSRSISSAAIMFIIFGFFCFTIGLLGEQLAQVRKRLARMK